MERLLRVASPLGLYAEEFDADTGRHLGNFPQAFSHLALIEAAARIILAERLEELAHEHDYDVIVIGSGAGGGTLVRRLAPSGKRILLLERGDWLPREPQNWLAHDVFVDNRYVSPDTWYDGDGQAVPAAGALLRRRRHQALRRGAVPAARGGLRRAAPPRRHLARVADRLRRDGAVLHQAEQLYQVHGARGEDPTEPPASAPYPFPAVSHEPRIQQLADDLAAAGHHPFHAPCGVMLDEARHALQRVRALRRPATASRAWCTPSPTPRCSRVRPALEHANVTLLTDAEAVRLETNAAGTAVTGVVVERDGERETFTADIVVVSCGAAN